MKNIRGFTLIEILVALVILAIIGAMMVVGLQSAIRTQGRINVKSERLSAVQSAMIILERDIEQIINRSIVASDDRTLPAVVLTADSDNQQTFEFTHAGLINPFALVNRTTMQRVSYTLKNQNLIRTTWAQLDRTPNTLPQASILLSGVNSFIVSLYYPRANSKQQPPQLEKKQTTSDTQGIIPATSTQAIPLPVAVEVVMDVDGVGTISRLIPLATAG